MIRDRLVVGIKEGSNVYKATAGPWLNTWGSKTEDTSRGNFLGTAVLFVERTWLSCYRGSKPSPCKMERPKAPNLKNKKILEATRKTLHTMWMRQSPDRQMSSKKCHLSQMREKGTLQQQVLLQGVSRDYGSESSGLSLFVCTYNKTKLIVDVSITAE